MTLIFVIIKNGWYKIIHYRYAFVLLLASVISCNNKHYKSVNGSYNSRSNLEYFKKKYSKAFFHYHSQNDSLKLKALSFLLSNLNDQYFFQGDWIDEYNKAVLKSKNNSISDLIYKLDSIKLKFSTKLNLVKDESIITDSYLIENIDRAFESRKFEWVKNLNFHDFCEYVLPYKVGNERPELWGTCLKMEKYLSNDSLLKLNNMFEATDYINNHLNWYKGTLNYDYPTDIGFKMSRIVATGTCYSMANVALLEMRALGLPGVIDYVPSWGNRSEGHTWNALIYKNRPFPFDPTGPNIGFYKIEFKGVDRVSYKISKVFRKTFEIQANSLNMLKDTGELIPSLFDNSRIKDVTDEYVPVCDIRLKYSSRFSSQFAYLCTFNNVDWIPSFWGRINEEQILFKNMGKDIVYLPALYSKFGLKPIGNPFILYKDGKSKELKANTKQTQTLLIKKKYPEDESNNIFKGDRYELLYWNGNWKSLGVQTATSNKLFYYKSPTNALFWIRDLTEGKQERIFTYENNEQIWW